MTTTASDLSFVLSGGSSNLDPNQSLGGTPSIIPITSGLLNNLFDNVTPDESDVGNTDFRCFYIANDGDSPIYNVKLFVSSDETGGADVELGIENRDELQRLTFTGVESPGGSIILQIEGESFTLVSNIANIAAWGLDLQNLLRGLQNDDNNPLFYDVEVESRSFFDTTINKTSYIFDINFINLDGQRSIGPITVVQNNLTPLGDVTVQVLTLQNGAPINVIAQAISSDTAIPSGVIFTFPTAINPITISYLNPADFFAVWVKRTTLADTEALPLDGFSVKLSADSSLS